MPELMIGVTDREGMYEKFVRASGIGIGSELFEMIFEFFKGLHTRDENEGTGIGLAIVRKIVERHGGGIWAEPEDGAGSTLRQTIRRP